MYKWGRSPLNWASRKGNIEFVKALIGYGADIKSKDKVKYRKNINTSLFTDYFIFYLSGE